MFTSLPGLQMRIRHAKTLYRVPWSAATRRRPHSCTARTPAATSAASSLVLPPLAYTITAPMQEDDDDWSTTGRKLRKTTARAFRPRVTRYVPYSYSRGTVTRGKTRHRIANGPQAPLPFARMEHGHATQVCLSLFLFLFLFFLFSLLPKAWKCEQTREIAS